MLDVLKVIIKSILKLILAAATMYFLFAITLGLIPVNSNYVSSQDGIEIYVSSNGIHLDFVLPVKTEYIDWRDHIPLEFFTGISGEVKFIAFGWGERNFYINTPEWKDLTAKTAITAMLWPTAGAMHVTYYYHAPLADKNTIPIQISLAEFQKLTKYILEYFKTENEQLILIPGAGYSNKDNFYEAHGKYHLFFTSNSWINRGLRKTGIRTAVWAPFDKSILYQLDQIRKEREKK